MGEVSLKIDALADSQKQMKASLPHIESLNQDPSQVELLVQVGGLFNGLIGTFSFGQGELIFDELVDVARMIDNVTSLYGKEDFSIVQDTHLAFINEASSLSLGYLDEYVKVGNIDSLSPRKSQLIALYNDLESVEEKEVLDQDDIDSLLDGL